MTDTKFFQTGYDQDACKIGVVHVGYGAFHRAHQAVYFDDYMQKTGDLGWGIAAVNLRDAESEAFERAADAQDGYLLKSISTDGTLEFRTVRSHVKFVDGAKDRQAALALVALPSVSILSMTVTESGYYVSDDWNLDTSAPVIADELGGGAPRSIYAFLAAALQLRAETTGLPITVMCCDNIRSNGKVLNNALQTYLKAAGQEELAHWVSGNVTFPCSMVDRITPRTTPELKTEIRQMFPKFGNSPVHAEEFIQWVIADDFAGPKPSLERVGAQFVADVEPYEEAKIRILNGGHTGLAYLGALAGHSTFDTAMRDPELRAHFDRWEEGEVLPGLGTGIPFDTTEYLKEIARRFENPGIADQIERICMDGYSKMAVFIRPTLRACLKQGLVPRAGFDCVASWVVYARKFAAGRTSINYVEPFWDRLHPMLADGAEEDLASDPNLWGDLPQLYPGFVPGIVDAIKGMETKWQD